MSIRPVWSASDVASTLRMFVLMPAIFERHVGEDPLPILDLQAQAHRVGERVRPLSHSTSISPLRIVEQVDDVRAGRGVDRDALAARDVADDLLAADRIAAARAEDHQVVEAADLDLVFRRCRSTRR